MSKLQGLYVITDEYICKGKKHREIAESALKGGAKIIQLRDKNCSDRYFYEAGLKIKELCKEYGAVFIVNDRVHIALALDADGVNVGQSDLPCYVVKEILGKNKIVGISASTIEEAVQAEKDGADYIGFGPVFPTETKKDCECVSGLEILKQVKESVNVPVAAIGGINKNNIGVVSETGADMCCVVSAVVCENNMTEATENLVKLI